MDEPTFDNAGYPTKETLRAIEDWRHDDPHGWFDFCKAAMPTHYAKIHDYVRDDPDFDRKVRTVIFITGGWSGNEDVLGAMRANTLWVMTWRQSCSGGMVTFAVPDSWGQSQSSGSGT